MPQDEKLIFLPIGGNILYKSNQDSRSLRAVVITRNKKKFAEFRAQLSDGYGMEVQQWEPEEGINLDNDSELTDTCKAIMQSSSFSPHFILREETTLRNANANTDITTLSLSELAALELESVLHTSQLNVYKPQWTEASETPLGTDKKKLIGFTLRQYEKRSYGYIMRNGKDAVCEHGFGWDAIFVNAATNLTNEEFYIKYGKISARQHTISDFIETYLRYKDLVTLKHHHLKLTRPIDFGERYFRLTEFVQQEKHLSNQFVHQWGIEKLRNAMLNEGLFPKAAWSRPVKNYFSPPFSGLPLTAKKDEAEETIFMTHDMLHHLICDLICDTEPSKAHFNIYSAWRMTSEACTLVLADMLYADSLIKSGVDRTYVDKRIYPLFEAIMSAQKIPDPDKMRNEEKIKFIKKLLFANVRYALLGDDSEWRALLLQADGKISADHLSRLKAYKDHFGKFFIGDNAWTRANFDNMQKRHESLSEWVNNIGKETFRKANIPLLSDVYELLTPLKIDLDNYNNVVNAVFNAIFDTKIRPHLERDNVDFEDDTLLQSRAFRRFLIGQASLFSRYPTPLNLAHIKEAIFSRLKNDAPFSNTEQDEIRSSIKQYILGIEGLRLMSKEEALNAIDCAPVFPAVYISYPDMQKKYTTIENCVRERVESYMDISPSGQKKMLLILNQLEGICKTYKDRLNPQGLDVTLIASQATRDKIQAIDVLQSTLNDSSTPSPAKRLENFKHAFFGTQAGDEGVCVKLKKRRDSWLVSFVRSVLKLLRCENEASLDVLVEQKITTLESCRLFKIHGHKVAQNIHDILLNPAWR